MLKPPSGMGHLLWYIANRLIEENHTPKRKRGRQSKKPKFIKKHQEKHDDKTIENKEKPDHDTEKDENRTRTHWRKAKRLYLVDQLAKHCWRLPKTPDEKSTKLTHTELTQILTDLLGI